MFLFLRPTLSSLSAPLSPSSSAHRRRVSNPRSKGSSSYTSSSLKIFFPNLMAQNSRGVELLKIMFPIEADVEGKASSKKKKKMSEDAAKLPGVHVRTQQVLISG